jgi:hypothetical protein
LRGTGALLVLRGVAVVADLVGDVAVELGVEAFWPGELTLVLRHLLRRQQHAILIEGPRINPAKLVAGKILVGLRIGDARAIGTDRIDHRLEAHRDHEVAVLVPAPARRSVISLSCWRRASGSLLRSMIRTSSSSFVSIGATRARS